MYDYAVGIGFCVLAWLANGVCIVQAARTRLTSELWMHFGLGTFFTLIGLMLIGDVRRWVRVDCAWLQVVGFVLYLPAAFLVLSALLSLNRRGRVRGSDPTATTALVQGGIYAVLRQPMTLGLAIWSVALMMVFQSLLAVLLGAASALCFRMAAKEEAAHNIAKFGDPYQRYMVHVPMWNPFAGRRR